MFDRLQFLFSEALTALRRNLLMTFAAISTVAISLFLIGGLGYVYYRVNQFSQTVPGMFDVRVYLRDGISRDEIRATASAIRSLPGVKESVWLPKDKMWERTRAENPQFADVPNPYPEAFKVTLSDLDAGPSVVQSIRAMPAVSTEANGVVYRSDEQRFVTQVLSIVRWVGSVAGGLLFVTAGLLIYNAIRLTILSRRLEIRIMRLVGASGFTVTVPFLIEGIVQGLLGGAVAAVLLWLSSNLVADFIGSHNALGHPPEFPLGTVTALLCCAGAAYGFLCSSLAARTPLRFR